MALPGADPLIMHPTKKTRMPHSEPIINSVRPLMLHEVTNQVASNVAAARRRMVPSQPSSGTANHSRHHVSRQTQA
jgi:hypothetical protein